VTGRGERGSALIPAISLLTLLGLLSALALLGGGADLLLAARMSRERAAFYAAQAALEESLSELAGASLIPEEAFLAPWPRVSLPVRRWRDGGWELSRRVATLPDAADADGDPATPVVLFDRRFGYAESPRAAGGFPVFQLVVTAESGEGRQAIVAEVAALTCVPAIAAAWTAGGPLELAGDVVVSGLAHAASGEPAAEGARLPAVLGLGTVSLAAGAAAEGVGGVGAAALLVDPGAPVPADALAALGAGGLLDRLEILAAPPADGPLSGIAWSRGDFTRALAGGGILVVHNAGFDPRRYEASRRALEEGVFGEDWDASYSHLDPAHQPARLAPAAAGAFSGVVIADALGTVRQPLTIAGGLVTLSRSPQRVAAEAPLRVLSSTTAVGRAGRGPLRHVTAFKALPAIEARME
jgi:hypothetical protein